jgi:hypothetical protein
VDVLNGSAAQLSSVALDDSDRIERLGSVPVASDTLDATKRLVREKGFEPLFPMDDSFGPNPLVRVANGNLELRLTRESDWKPLAKLNSPDRHFAWYTPHGVFFFDTDSAGKVSLFRISLEGGQPVRLGDAPPGNLGSLSLLVSPDERKVLVEGNNGNTTETWLLENFVPKAQATR